MSYATTDLGEQFLADFIATDPPPAAGSVYGFRSLMKRLVTHCPTIPVPAPAFRHFLDDTGKSALLTVRRRYDFANRVFRSDRVQALGISNPCDLVARPGKIVTSSVRQRREHTRIAPAAPAVAPVDMEPVAETQLVEQGVVSTQEVVDLYLERCRQKPLAKTTIVNYSYVLNFLAEVSPTLPETEDDVYEVMGDPEYYKNGTRRQHFGALSAFHNSPTYQALKLPHPLENVQRPPKKATPKRTFTDQEIESLLSVATPQEAAFVRLGLDAGPRVGEAASLTIDRIKDYEVEVDGKGGLRWIPIHLDIAEELRALANDRGEIWHDARGRLTDSRLAGRFRRHAERAGITGDQIGPHTLRRSFATRWANDGGGMPQLQAILGHADLATTMEYVDMTPEHVKRAHGEFSAAAQMGLVGRDKTTSRCSHGLGNGVFGISALDAATALRLGADEVRTQVMVQYLSETPCVERANGRRLKVLPPEIAQLVILDLEAGHSRSAIVRRYKRVAPFSRDWLTSRIVDRGLWEMAGWGDRVFDRGEAAATEDSEHDFSV